MSDLQLVIYQEGSDPHLIRDVFSEVLSLHPTDAMRLVAHAPGVIPLKLDKKTMDLVVALLKYYGIDSEGLPVDSIPDLSERRVTHKVLCRTDGLQVLGTRADTIHWLPWEHVELLSVGVILSESGSDGSQGAWVRTAARVFASPLRPPKLATKKGESEGFSSPAELWIVRRQPVQSIRIHQSRMNYEYLEDRLESSTATNFRTLLADIQSAAPTATLTPATNSFLRHDRTGCHYFHSAKHFGAYTTLQLLLRWRDNRAQEQHES